MIDILSSGFEGTCVPHRLVTEFDANNVASRAYFTDAQAFTAISESGDSITLSARGSEGNRADDWITNAENFMTR